MGNEELKGLVQPSTKKKRGRERGGKLGLQKSCVVAVKGKQDAEVIITPHRYYAQEKHGCV